MNTIIGVLVAAAPELRQHAHSAGACRHVVAPLECMFAMATPQSKQNENAAVDRFVTSAAGHVRVLNNCLAHPVLYYSTRY